MEREMEMTYCPNAYRDENWKRKPGYFGWVRMSKNGLRPEPDPHHPPWPHAVLCIAVVLPEEVGMTIIPVEPCERWLNRGVNWNWNGDKLAPTLSPSVVTEDRIGAHAFICADPSLPIVVPESMDEKPLRSWHGWIRDGKLINAQGAERLQEVT